jgi:hypothetical protein
MLSEEGFNALGAEGIEDFLYYLERKGTEVLHKINQILPMGGIECLRFRKIEEDGTLVFKGHESYMGCEPNIHRYEFPASYLFNNDWVEEMEEEAKRRKEYEALMAEKSKKATEENRLSTLRGLMEKYPEEVLNYKVKLVG